MKHNTVLCLLVFLLLGSCKEQNRSKVEQDGQTAEQNTSASAKESDQPESVPRNVEDIQETYASIITQLENGILDSTTFKYSCYNEKGGTATYFSYKNQLRLIVHQYHEYDHHSAIDRYFIKDSVLFFINLNRTLWSFESGPEGSTKDDITEQRIYLIDQKPVKCLEKKFTVRSQVTSNPNPQTIPNKEIDCSSLKSVLNPYQVLLKYRHSKSAGCLED